MRSATAGRTGSTIRPVEQLTVDDSWVQEQVAIGQLSESEMHSHRNAHAITRWLGEDAPGGAPRVTTFVPPIGGTARPVLGRPVELRPHQHPHAAPSCAPIRPPRPRSTSPARSTQIALASGGRDNITVVVVDVVPSTVATRNGESPT